MLVESLGDFFKNLGNNGLNVSKKKARNVAKNPGRVLKSGANVDGAVASRSPKAVLSSLPEVITFYHTVKRLHLGNFGWFSTIKMDQKTDRKYPSAPLHYENFDLEQRLEKKLNDVKSFNNSIKIIKEMITQSKDKTHKLKKRYKIRKNSEHNSRINRHNCYYWSNNNF